MQNTAANLINQGNRVEAIDLLSNFGYSTAVKWHDDWLKFGDDLYGTYMWGYKDMKAQAPKGWWADVLQKAPVNPVPFK